MGQTRDETVLEEHQYVDADGIPLTMRAVVTRQNESYEAHIENGVVWGDLVTYHATLEAAAKKSARLFPRTAQCGLT